MSAEDARTDIPQQNDGASSEEPEPQAAGEEPPEGDIGFADPDEGDFDEVAAEYALHGGEFAGLPFGRQPYPVIVAPRANINTGSVHGGQRVENHGGTTGTGGRRVEAHEGPISAVEILDAQAGFAEPDWFPAALAELDSRLLFLTGEPGTGRRTAALNLLRRHSGGSMNLRAVDGDMNLASWRPKHRESRGYLVDGLLPEYPLKPGMVRHLQSLLSRADARMVVVLPDDPALVRRLSRELHVTPVRCAPPAARAVFDARFADAVPDPSERARRLALLEPGLLDELLAPELVPAQVAELVAAVAAAEDGGPDLADIEKRLSFLAEGEVPDLLAQLRDDADGLAFLLATCVFEGLDHRIVREEAERLLELADGRLSSVLPEGADGSDEDWRRDRERKPRPNPQFVFRRSLDELLRTVRAQCSPREIRSNSGYTYAVEAVRFTRHRQAEAVLRHVWREYGHLSRLLTEWMADLKNEQELTEPVGRVMGLAAGWGGGRRALQHIGTLATSSRRSSRTIAAYALGMAAGDPILAREVKYRLSLWSAQQSWQVRSTVAYTCGADFGASRPEVAMRLLRNVPRGQGDEHERTVDRAVRDALNDLFASGSQATVFRHLAEWADGEGPLTDVALRTLPQLLQNTPWCQEQLVNDGEYAAQIIGLVHRTLNDEELFVATCNAVLWWCRMAAWGDLPRTAVETLLSALAADFRHGVLRLFVVIDRADVPDLAGLGIARDALHTWRNGEQPWQPVNGSTHPNGRTS
ncbi:hypothetical protein [Streptomyces sp. RPA4-5]|uniref:hypothetical protein n=1 Tax=Streptomyces sp. RPA4-5 TaxID=2721245 RepID=UPI002001E2E6|nr:hypothetical protein [Streptomyces sp. RPA4-5]